MAAVAIVLGIVTVNVTNWHGEVLLYRDTASWLGVLLAPPLMGGAVAAAGVLVSLRAATVRSAQQTLAIGTVVIFLAVSFGAGALPAGVREWFTRILLTWSGTEVTLAGCAIVLAVDLLLVLAAMGRFQRAKLVLD